MTELDQTGTGEPSIGIDGAGGPEVDNGSTADWTPLDPDGDGYADVLSRMVGATWEVVVDADLDGVADDAWAADSDGDGRLDIRVLRQGSSWAAELDVDGDGVFEHRQEITVDQLREFMPHVADLLQPTTGDPGNSSPGADTEGPDVLVEDGRLVGDPLEASERWFQQSQNGFCVPASIAQVVSEYTGVHYADEQAFVQLANDIGAWSVSPDGVPGMTMPGAVELLQASGVPAQVVYGDTATLEQWLEQDRGVVVFVDSGELWTQEPVEDDAPDHAVVVSGIDTERGVVVLSDPGSPEGDAKEYPLDQFLDAWEDSGGQAVVCDEPAPPDAPNAGPEGSTKGAAAAGGQLATAQQAGVLSKVLAGPWAILPVRLAAAAL